MSCLKCTNVPVTPAYLLLKDVSKNRGSLELPSVASNQYSVKIYNHVSLYLEFYVYICQKYL